MCWPLPFLPHTHKCLLYLETEKIRCACAILGDWPSQTWRFTRHERYLFLSSFTKDEQKNITHTPIFAIFTQYEVPMGSFRFLPKKWLLHSLPEIRFGRRVVCTLEKMIPKTRTCLSSSIFELQRYFCRFWWSYTTWNCHYRASKSTKNITGARR